MKRTRRCARTLLPPSNSSPRSFANFLESRSQEGLMRFVLALSLVGLIAAGGCRMCASPYDYCGPVVECDDSVHPAAYTMPSTSAAPETLPAPRAKPSQAPTPS